MSQKALVGVTNSLPSSPEELARIEGIGKRFLEKYAGHILPLVARFREETGQAMPFETAAARHAAQTDPTSGTKTGKIRTDTRRTTLAMILEGRSAEEIARIRGLSVATVEGHIAGLIRNGSLDVGRFVPDDRIATIARYLDGHPDEKLSEIREHLGCDFSYAEIRFVRSARERNETTEKR